VLFRQFVDDDLGCASYLIGDEATGIAAVVDPALRIEPYLEEAERRGLEIVRVLETHTHADHVSGHGRFALEHAVPVSIHPLGEPEYPFDPLEDGREIELGDVVLTVLHTPGHRPEHCCFAVADRSRADEPWLVLTGDSLFVGDAARPDLAVEAREGAAELYRSLQRLAALGDGVELYPGHVAGSMCGAAGMSSKGSSTIGFERRFNPMLRIESEEDFVGESTGTAGVKPPNVEHVVSLNRGPFLGATEPPGVVAADGAVVLDVRPARAFAAGHVAGALSVPLDSSGFGTKAGFVVGPDEAFVLHAESEADAELAARRLAAVGLRARGRLDSPQATETLDPVELDELERLVAEDAVEVVDVREADERDEGYIPGSRHVPYRLVRTFAESLGNGKPVVTICESGSRAGIAASVLAAAGVEARPVLDAGVGDWQARGGPVVEFRRCGST
jgi:hydroxyacylglutathione hydrolase